MRKLPLIFLLGFAVLSNNCKKSSGGNSNTTLLTTSAWIYDTGGIDADNNGTIDSPFPAGFIQTCEADNLISFKADGSGVIDEGATKCNAADPQDRSFNWSFKNNGTVLNIPDSLYGLPGGDLKINILTSTKLEFEKQVQITTPITTTVYAIIDLKH
jgi:hypothetical protein